MDSRRELEITAGWQKADTEAIDIICHLLNTHEIDVQKYLADMVASLCRVSIADLLSEKQKTHIAHSRWLYWYAYRYMTNEPYYKMAEVSSTLGARVSEQGISAGINKMQDLINNNNVWQQRWYVLKKIIKLRKQEKEVVNATITIQVPKELKNKIKFDIKNG